jgi:hypothetical protein
MFLDLELGFNVVFALREAYRFQLRCLLCRDFTARTVSDLAPNTGSSDLRVVPCEVPGHGVADVA